MKGHKTIDLNGRKIPLKFTVGVMEDMQEQVDGDIDKALEKMSNMRQMIALMAKYAGEEVDAEELKQLDFGQLAIVTDFISETVQTVGNPTAGKPRQRSKSK